MTTDLAKVPGVSGKPLDEYEIMWGCRLHPIDWWHETGCPHIEWTREQLQSAIETHKRNEAYHAEIFRAHPEVLVPKQ